MTRFFVAMEPAVTDNQHSTIEPFEWGEALARAVLPPLLFSAVCWLALGVSDLLFYVLADLFSIVVALASMGVATTSARFTKNHFVVFVSLAIGWCAGIDLAHTLAFKGMHLLPGDTANASSQLWVAARYMQALALLSSPLALRRQFPLIGLHLVFGVCALALMTLVFSGHFPNAYVEGQGPTDFKIDSEFAIMAMLGVAVVSLWRVRALMTPRVYYSMVAAIVTMLLSEFCFTLDARVYGNANLIGPVLKIFSYWFVYIAMVRNTIRDPFVQLQDEIYERQQLACEREVLLNDLRDRINELRCINAVSELVERSQLQLEELLGGVAALLPTGFVLPEQVRVSIQSDRGNFGSIYPDVRPRQELTQPLMLDDRSIGTMLVWYPDELGDSHAHFSLEEKSLLRNIARQVCDAIKRMHGAERVERLRYLYEMLSATGHSVVHSQTRQELLGGLYDALIAHGTFPLLFLAETTEGGWPLRLGAHHGVPDWLVPALTGALQDPGNRLVSVLKAVQFGQVDSKTLDHDYEREVFSLNASPMLTQWRGFLRECGVLYRAVLPLRCEGRLEGVVVLFARGLKPYDTEQLRLLQEIAEEMSFALEKLARQTQLLETKKRATLLEMRFQEVFKVSPVPMHIVALEEQRIRAINDAHEQWLGYPLSEISMMDDWFRIVFSDAVEREKFRQRWFQSIELAKSGEPVQSAEMTLRCKDGSQKIARARMTMVGHDAIVVWTDLTEIRRNEMALQESERRFRSMVEQTITAMYVRRAGRYIYVNPRFAEITGWQAEELVGKSVLDFTTQEPENLQLIAQVSAELHDGKHQSVSYIIPFCRKDGQLIQIGLTAKIIVWDDGAPATIVLATDVTEQKRAEVQIAAYVKQLEAAMRGTLQAVSNMVEMRDPYTAGHERRVGLIASAIAREMGWRDDRCDSLELLGLVHDIGKIAIPSEILNKPTRLTPLEMEMMKGHVQAGYEILKNVPFPVPVAEVIRQHHERMDGSGYPQGLKGDEILPEARVLAVADVLESMATHRPYRPAIGLDAALTEIVSNRAKLYAPEVVDAVVRLVRDKGYQLPA